MIYFTINIRNSVIFTRLNNLLCLHLLKALLAFAPVIFELDRNMLILPIW